MQNADEYIWQDYYAQKVYVQYNQHFTLSYTKWQESKYCNKLEKKKKKITNMTSKQLWKQP